MWTSTKKGRFWEETPVSGKGKKGSTKRQQGHQRTTGPRQKTKAGWTLVSVYELDKLLVRKPNNWEDIPQQTKNPRWMDPKSIKENKSNKRQRKDRGVTSRADSNCSSQINPDLLDRKGLDPYYGINLDKIIREQQGNGTVEDERHITDIVHFFHPVKFLGQFIE